MGRFSNVIYISIIISAAVVLFSLSSDASAAGLVGKPCSAAEPCEAGLRCDTDGACSGGSGAAVGQRCGSLVLGVPPVSCAEGLSCDADTRVCARPPSAATETEGEGIIIKCALNAPGSGYCDDVNDLLLQLIQIGKEAFKYIGALAFFFFIYGGLTVVLSMGNAEKAKKGHQILVAAVIGLLIAFSAYILIDFVLDALGVVPEFRGVQ